MEQIIAIVVKLITSYIKLLLLILLFPAYILFYVWPHSYWPLILLINVLYILGLFFAGVGIRKLFRKFKKQTRSSTL